MLERDGTGESPPGAGGESPPGPLPAVEPVPAGPALEVAAVDSLVTQARGLSVAVTDDRVGDRDLEALAGRLESLRRVTDALAARVNGELDARRCTDTEHGHSTKTWTAATFQVPSEEAGRRVKTARLLRHCPVLAAALAAGRISADHVRVIANATNSRNLHVVVGLQQQLIDMTGDVVLFRFWAAQVTDLLRLTDTDGPEPAVEDAHLHLDRQYDGTSRLNATLTPAHADVVQHALDTFADRIYRRYRNDADAAPEDVEIPSRSTLMALALEEICRTALADTHTGAGTAAEITYVIHSEDPDITWSLDGRRVDTYTARLACCDGVYQPIVMDRFGVPLDAGRATRFATTDQRRAAHRRDGGCVFPGCDTPARHTDLHHVQHWEHDGPTDLANLASLCRHHHGVIHRNGWTMTTTEHQRFTITTPTGRTLHSQQHGRPTDPT